MKDKLKRLDYAELVEPAGTKALLEVEAQLGHPLPDAVARVLRASDGVMANLVCIYGTEDLPERNETWEVAVYAPGYVAIGDDHGGRVALVALNGSPGVFAIGVGDMNPNHFETVASDVDAWVEAGCPFEIPQPPPPAYVQAHDLIREHNWDDGVEPIAELLDDPTVQRASALLAYWLLEAPWHRFPISEVGPHPHSAFVETLERRLLSGFYSEGELALDAVERFKLSRVQAYKLKKAGLPASLLRA